VNSTKVFFECMYNHRYLDVNFKLSDSENNIYIEEAFEKAFLFVRGLLSYLCFYEKTRLSATVTVLQRPIANSPVFS
jgi:hypothetical protein